MENYRKQVADAINREDKEGAILAALEGLAKGALDVVTLYEEVLTPALASIASYDQPQEIKIWQEHVRTSIVRTIIECAYPYVLKERDQKYGGKGLDKVVVLCPADEYHEVGPRMVSDFFTLCGYEAIFVGGNTPKEEVLAIAKAHRPAYLAISVSNYYHLVAAAKAISFLRQGLPEPVKVVAGGHAFIRNPEAAQEIGADILLKDFREIQGLSKGDVL